MVMDCVPLKFFLHCVYVFLLSSCCSQSERLIRVVVFSVSAENLPLKCCSYTQLHDVEFPLRDTNSSFQARLAKDDVD